MKEHYYEIKMTWTGNTGTGTSAYTAYERSHIYTGKGKSIEIPGSSDPAFRGDDTRYNPEELLVSSISSCHMLWYLHLCAENKIIVNSYMDDAKGVMTETENGSGKFSEVTLYPQVTVLEESMIAKAEVLHHRAHEMCFVANSCNFPIYCKPDIMAVS
jgi:organic hydroperoxide reductase OsmC/OhrA